MLHESEITFLILSKVTGAENIKHKILNVNKIKIEIQNTSEIE